MKNQYRVCSIPDMDAETFQKVFDDQTKAVEALELLKSYHQYLQSQGIIHPDSYIYVEQEAAGNWEPLSKQVIEEGVIKHG